MKSEEEYRNAIARKASARIEKRKQRNRMITVACLVFVVCVVAAIPGWVTEKTKQEPAFGGFILTAYAAREEDEMIASDFMSDANAIILRPHAEVLLGAYSPLMSSAPGLPFRFNAESDCEIEVSADNGVLCSWDPENGAVTQYGKATTCERGEILCWSPLGDNEETVKNATITVTAIRKGQQIARQEITIVSNDAVFYSACMDDLQGLS